MTLNDCIAILNEMKSKNLIDKEDRTRMLYNMKMTLTGLYNGKEVFRRTEEYVNDNAYESAILYLQKAFRKDKFWILYELKSKRMKGVIFMSIVCLITTVILLIIGFNLTRLGEESLNWPQTNGLILQSYFTKEVNSDNDVNYRTKIEYSYKVNGKEYVSDQQTIDNVYAYSDKSKAESVVNQYPKDSGVNVYYKPDDHAFSVLRPGLKGKFHFAVYMGFAVMLISFILVFLILYPNLKLILKKGKCSE